MKHPKPRTLVLAAIACCLAAGLSGCSGEAKDLSNTQVAGALAYDSAYVTVNTLQNTDAVNYSKTILKTTSDPEIKAFANNVIAVRAAEDKKMAKIKDVENIDPNDPTTPAEASEQLDLSLRKMGVNAQGTPSAAPSTDAGYITAMLANIKASLATTRVEILEGGPGGVPFAKQVFLDRTNELEQLKALN